MGLCLQSVDEVVEEIMRIHRSLPARPVLEDVEAAKVLIRNVEKEELSRIDAISKQKKGVYVPEELFFVLQEMQKNLVYFQSTDQKREALKLLNLENIHALFDEFVQRASRCLSSSENYSQGDYSNGSVSTVSGSFSTSTAGTSSTLFDSVTTSSVFYSEKEIGKSSELFTRDDSYLKKPKSTMYADGIGVGPDSSRGVLMNSSIKLTIASGEDGDKLSPLKLASLIEVSVKKGTRDLDLHNKLMEQIDWLPDSIGKLSCLINLDLSENRIIALPATIGGLSSLTKLDLHSNRLSELPNSIGDLFSLVYLDLRGNQLTSLPATIGKLVRLEDLDLSSNQLSSISETIGTLISLKRLNVETNDIEELPHTIGQCSSLVELRADYNRLKALPEAIGRIQSLEILSVRYNNIKGLPTTMASMSSLKELDVSFNELESVPESLCFATSLVKMNLGNNFSDLRLLPRSIGNLDMLEELDISNNQIRVLPDSFGMLSKLRVLRAEENPLEVPPRHVAEIGAEAVVRYMAELIAKREAKTQPTKAKETWAQFCFFSRPNKRKHDGVDYVKT
ncbi:plant intracellular Ras-group-related LRR protein 4-like [Magnolia sinica]|uniref:plant intracellular Ras-group-related LRR protein 4-like n=1 Tax=Magnolia sinica TaxID=86752 RepID=UPI00265ABA59|nr:plant intracellular Ras-group-related LRR protein 4-like [Magnolia sinica]XP_058073401.1 plant intracellular Ras-group-related LRR protein 4-like [Magnolia sinica]